MMTAGVMLAGAVAVVNAVAVVSAYAAAAAKAAVDNAEDAGQPVASETHAATAGAAVAAELVEK